MKKMSKESAIQFVIDNEIEYEHLIHTFYNNDDFVIQVALIKDNPKDVADEIYEDLYSDKHILKILNNLDCIVKLVIYNPYNYKAYEYEM